MRIAEVAGKEAEQDLTLAGPHRFLLPFLTGLDQFPAPQRDALRAAFGLVAGIRPDRLRLSIATLTPLANSATDQPPLCVCDDAQWIDEESLRILAFVARRLHADRIVPLFAIRDAGPGGRSLDYLPQAVLPELSRTDSHALLAQTLSVQIEPDIAERIVTEASGNPPAIRELAGALDSPAGADPVPLSERSPLGHQLQARYLRRSRALPLPTRTLLLVVAADPTGDRELIWRAVTWLDGTGGTGDLADLATPAIAAGLLLLQPAPAFRHPLIRSAVYDGSTPADRRRAHAALAAVTDARTDADRRAWHLAEPCDGPDEMAAAELERAAARLGTRWLQRGVRVPGSRGRLSSMLSAPATMPLTSDSSFAAGKAPVPSNADETAAAAWEDRISEVPCRSCLMWS